MEAKTKSDPTQAFIRFLLWVAAAAMFNLVIYFAFGPCKMLVSTITLSVLGLIFQLGMLFHCFIQNLWIIEDDD